ncbi:MAG: hypothetical protein U9N72_05690 [Bacteroidota bacterium]|nr:hypothetical protein [Bacteroidota bacterium]
MVKTNRVEVIDLISRRPVTTIKALRITAADINPENNVLVYARLNGDIIFYNIETREKITSCNLSRCKPIIMAWSNKGQYLAIGCRDNMLILFDTDKKKILNTKSLNGKGITDLKFSDDGKYLGISMLTGEVEIIDTENWKSIHYWKAHTGKARALAFHPSGKYIASGGEDKMVHIWEVPSGNEVHRLSAHDREILSLDFSPDGTMLASGCAGQPVE